MLVSKWATIESTENDIPTPPTSGGGPDSVDANSSQGFSHLNTDLANLNLQKRKLSSRESTKQNQHSGKKVTANNEEHDLFAGHPSFPASNPPDNTHKQNIHNSMNNSTKNYTTKNYTTKNHTNHTNNHNNNNNQKHNQLEHGQRSLVDLMDTHILHKPNDEPRERMSAAAHALSMRLGVPEKKESSHKKILSNERGNDHRNNHRNDFRNDHRHDNHNEHRNDHKYGKDNSRRPWSHSGSHSGPNSSASTSAPKQEADEIDESIKAEVQAMFDKMADKSTNWADIEDE